jgi:hypothetical protein
MNKKAVTCFLLFLLEALTLIVVQASAADVTTDNYIAYGSGVCLYSPLNRTYATSLVPLNLNFSKGMGMDCNLSYSLDGQSSHDIPLTVIPGQELHITTETEASLQLPQLSDGTHCLTIIVNASADGSYTHSWVHTVYFTVQTGNPTPTLSAAPSPTPTSTIENIDANVTPTAQPAAGEIQQNQLPLMIVIIVAAFAVYIAVIAVLSSKKIR